jgi:pyruvate,water dikinase
MEQMMGVREPMPDALVAEIEREASVGPLRDAWHLARTLAGLVARALLLPRTIRAFHARLNTALDAATTVEIETLAPHELVHHYQQLEASLLRRWDAPLINDFFAMIACGVLRKWSANWLDDESLANLGLRDIGEIVSLEPARRIQAMAAKSARSESIEADLADYIEKFGDRCVEELKLESPTLGDDPGPLHRAIDAMAARIRENPAPPAKPPADTTLESAIARLPWHRRHLYRWMLEKARLRVRDRENLRFERTRLFGRVRRILRGLGVHLVHLKRLHHADDVFYAELGEVLGFFDGTAPAPISQKTIDARRAEFEHWRNAPAPPDRFETVGPPSLAESIIARPVETAIHGADLCGIGACAGIVRGPVRVVIDPRGVELARGEILVAQQTDPGWVVLFPAAAGLLVERGSLLSHSAIVAREMGIPAVVSIPGVTAALTDGEWVEMDGTSGTIRHIDPDH